MPVEARIADCAALIGAQGDLDVIAAQWIVIFKLNIMRIKMPAVSGVFIMLDDYFTIEDRPYLSKQLFTL